MKKGWFQDTPETGQEIADRYNRKMEKNRCSHDLINASTVARMGPSQSGRMSSEGGQRILDEANAGYGMAKRAISDLF